MTNRMYLATLALIGLLISAYMAAYKFGFVGSLMCGTGSCEIVQNSPWAVQFGIPVPVLGLIGYGGMFILAMIGLQPRFEDERWVAIVLFAGALGGVLFSAWLSYLEQYEIQHWCRWCISSAIVAVLVFLSALPELSRMRGAAPVEAAE
jgi:uncharacterized membrane protein